MRFLKFTGKTVLTALMVSVLALFFGILIHESYSTGKAVESRNKITQTIAILDLTAENEDLKTTIITLNGDNATLRILTQTQQEEIDNLKSTVTSLNSSLTSLRNEKEATDEVVNNLQNDIEYLNNYVSELESELSQFKKDFLIIYLPQDFIVSYELYYHKINDNELFVSSDNSDKCPGLWKYNINTLSLTKVLDVNCIFNSFYDFYDYTYLVPGGRNCHYVYKKLTFEFIFVGESYSSKFYYNEKMAIASGKFYFDIETETGIGTGFDPNSDFVYSYDKYLVFSNDSSKYYGILNVDTMEWVYDSYSLKEQYSKFVYFENHVFSVMSSSELGFKYFNFATAQSADIPNFYADNVYALTSNKSISTSNFVSLYKDRYLLLYNSTLDIVYSFDIETLTMIELLSGCGTPKWSFSDDEIFLMNNNTFEFYLVNGLDLTLLFTHTKSEILSGFKTKTGYIFSCNSSYSLIYYDFESKQTTCYTTASLYNVSTGTTSSYAINGYYSCKKSIRINDDYLLLVPGLSSRYVLIVNNDLSFIGCYRGKTLNMYLGGIIYENNNFMVTKNGFVINRETVEVTCPETINFNNNFTLSYVKDLDNGNILLRLSGNDVYYEFDVVTGDIDIYMFQTDIELSAA